MDAHFKNKIDLSDLENGKLTIRKVKNLLQDKHAVDVSVLLNTLEAARIKDIFRILNRPLAAEVVKYLEPQKRQELITSYPPQQSAAFIQLLDSDDIADILQELKLKEREQILGSFDDFQKADAVTSLLKYDEDTAGGLMATELIKTNINWEIRECIEEIRLQSQRVNKVYSIYVVDDENCLRGTVSLKKIISTDDKTLVSDIYDPNVIKVENFESLELVVETMQHYDLESLPVTNIRGQLLGRITIDDIIDIITEKAETTQQIMSGIASDVEEKDTIWRVSKARLPWLIIGITGGILGAWFISLFEKDLIYIPAMAFFIPLITATGGNVGIQSSTLVVQALSGDAHYFKNLLPKLLKTSAIAVLNALIICLLLFSLSFLFTTYLISLVVSVALFFVILISSLIGTLTPIILHQVNINPALASGPFITTLNDLVGLAIYFGLARLLVEQIAP